MAVNDNIRGVARIQIGPPGDGVVGTTLTEFSGRVVVLNSATFTGAEANQETIATEGADAYLSLNTGATPASLNFKLLEVTGDAAVMLMGGSYDSTSKTWKAPNSLPDKYLSVVLTSEAIDGKKATITIPYAKVVARHDGSITKNDLLSVDVIATANTPVAADGTENAPFEIQIVDA